MTPALGLYGGSFDPPHRGHVELADRAKRELGLDRLLVLVSADPGHKHVGTPADIRLRLTRAAFPDDDVVLDPTARTIDLLRAHPEWRDPLFLIGADQFSDFPAWKEPGEVLELARLAVATRPGFPQAVDTYTCSGVAQAADGLHFSACGTDGDLVVPSGAA